MFELFKIGSSEFSEGDSQMQKEMSQRQHHGYQSNPKRKGKRNRLSRMSPTQGLRQVVQNYLHLDDPWVIDIALGTVVANTLPGEPLWVLLVNPASTGKTEFVQMFNKVPFCGWLPEVTENTFLSGLKSSNTNKEGKDSRKHSLLHRWTNPELLGGKSPIRVMLVQDLTGLITVNKGKRDAVFGQLRQIYDGRFVRSTGMGEDLLWEGYLGLLGAVTPVYDQVAELNSILGERFMLYRPHRKQIEAEAHKALEITDPSWRGIVAKEATKAVVDAVRLLPQIQIPKWVTNRLISLSLVTTTGRTGVVRDGYRRALTYLPESEGPGRFIKQLKKLLQGLCAVRGFRRPNEKELAILAKVARDTIPKHRWVVIEALYGKESNREELARKTNIPPSTLFYLLEELMVLGIAQKEDEVWALTGRFRGLCQTAKVMGGNPLQPDSGAGGLPQEAA